jgi:predicted amidohydrolase YtcJ
MVAAKPDLVLRNARVITMDARRPLTRTVYAGKGRIVRVSSRDIAPGTARTGARVIDCAGRTVLPGFHDAHCHIVALAESALTLDAGPGSVRSVEDIVNRVREAAAGLPAGTWIRCGGYNEFYLAEGRHPLARDLDRATTAHPVRLTHRSGHAHVLNSPALALAGIGNESEEPAGGMIERDLESGLPNGLLFGMGNWLAQRLAPPGEEEMDAAMARAGRMLLSLGLTTLQDASPGNGMARWGRFLRWKKKGLFRPRIVMMFGAAEMESLQGRQPFYDRQTGLGSGAVKLTLDEVRGSLNPPQDELNQLMLAIQARGLQAAIHAVEETTVEAAISALEYAQARLPGSNCRHRLEHCSVCTPQSAARLASLGACVVTNPAFIYYSGDRYLAEVPPAQMEHLYAVRTMLSAGIRTAAGSDAPVAGPDPLRGICAAVSRRSSGGRQVLAREAVTTMEALRMYTLDAAWSCFRERQSGSITAGKDADLVVVSGDPLDAGLEWPVDAKVEMTILGGKVVFP